MTTYRIGVVECDGIGPEIVRATLRVLEAATQEGPTLELVHLPAGLAAIRRDGHALPQATIDGLSRCHGWIMGPHDSLSYPEEARLERNPSGELRRRFDLYANIRPARTYPGVPSLAGSADMVVVRENTEGFYADRNMFQGSGEYMPTPDLALTVGVFTRTGARRIADAAFRLARSRRRQVAIVHKQNVFRLAYGLFLEECHAVAANYPDVKAEDYIVDAMTAHLLRRPGHFDVILTTNMFGDILSDMTAELTGSLGMAGSINAGDRHAMAQAAHGSAPDIAGQGIANPSGMILSTALLMRWLADRHEDPLARRAGERMEAAVASALEAGVRTRDLGGSAGTVDFTAAVAERAGRAS